MILFVHNRYRTTGGEERVVEQLEWLVREHLREEVARLESDSASLHRLRAGFDLLRGGREPGTLAAGIATAARSGQPPILHAHNLLPSFGWRTLAAARAAGARVVWHLHQYRLVCANGVTFTRGAQCTRCHGRWTLPGVALRCRGGVAEAAAYGLALALWQRRAAGLADAVIVPSEFARERLRALGAPLDWDRTFVVRPPVPEAPHGTRKRGAEGGYALIASRLSQEKGVDVGIAACLQAGVPLVVAGDGPERARLEAIAEQGGRGGSAGVRFLGRVDEPRLAELRAAAAIALVPSRSENFPTAAAEAMAAGLPVVATRTGGTPELVDPAGLVDPDDPRAMAAAVERLWDDAAARSTAIARVRAICAPDVVARQLATIYRRARSDPAAP